LANLSAYLSDAAVYIPIISTVTGSIMSLFKPFLVPEKEFSVRINMRKEVLSEKLARELGAVLNASLSMESSDDLRGTSDLIGGYTSEVFRVFDVVSELERIRDRVRKSYGTLLFTVGVAILSLVLALAWPSSRAGVALFSLFLILLQFSLAYILRSQEGALERYERTT